MAAIEASLGWSTVTVSEVCGSSGVGGGEGGGEGGGGKGGDEVIAPLSYRAGLQWKGRRGGGGGEGGGNSGLGDRAFLQQQQW